MTSHKTPDKRLGMFKSKGANWKDVLRSQKLHRLKTVRSKRIEESRHSALRNIQLEDDLQLEEDLRGEELEQEYQRGLDQLYGEFDAVDCPCPICGQEVPIFAGGNQPRTVECKTCGFTTELGWEEFQECIRVSSRQHSEGGCPNQAEFITFEGELFIACEACDHLDAAL